MWGTVPDFFMKMPTELANLYSKGLMDLDTWKTTMTRKDILLVLYTDALTRNDKLRTTLYKTFL